MWQELMFRYANSLSKQARLEQVNVLDTDTRTWIALGKNVNDYPLRAYGLILGEALYHNGEAPETWKPLSKDLH